MPPPPPPMFIIRMGELGFERVVEGERGIMFIPFIPFIPFMVLIVFMVFKVGRGVPVPLSPFILLMVLKLLVGAFIPIPIPIPIPELPATSGVVEFIVADVFNDMRGF
jgi:hypothetical protein